MADFFKEVEKAVDALRKGEVILYPTDTIWGIGCDASNEAAVDKIYKIKEREDHKSLIVLMADEREVLQYIASPDLAVFDFLAAQSRPTTVIFEHAIGLPERLLGTDGSLGVRLVRDEFCRHLIKRLKKPLVSTSANISSQPSPRFFSEISPAIRDRVDHIVEWRQDDQTPAEPSQIVKWKNDGSHEFLRR